MRRPSTGQTLRRVDGRWTQHDTSLYGQFQKAIGWTAEDMVAQYGELATEGFTGDRVAAEGAVPPRLAGHRKPDAHGEGAHAETIDGQRRISCRRENGERRAHRPGF